MQVAAMQPRMLMTLDEEMKPLPVTVRVGQSVDVVGQVSECVNFFVEYRPGAYQAVATHGETCKALRKRG